MGHRREGLKGELVVGDGIKLRIRMPVTYFQRSNQQKNTRSPFRVRSHWIKNHATQIDPAHGSKRGELINEVRSKGQAVPFSL